MVLYHPTSKYIPSIVEAMDELTCSRVAFPQRPLDDEVLLTVLQVHDGRNSIEVNAEASS